MPQQKSGSRFWPEDAEGRNRMVAKYKVGDKLIGLYGVRYVIKEISGSYYIVRSCLNPKSNGYFRIDWTDENMAKEKDESILW